MDRLNRVNREHPQEMRLHNSGGEPESRSLSHLQRWMWIQKDLDLRHVSETRYPKKAVALLFFNDSDKVF
jgi:hypothetical protein